MDVNDILKLVNAGFTKADIMQLAAAKTEDLPPAPEGEAAPEEEPAPAKPAAEDITQKLLNGITGQLQALTSAVQAGNIRGADAPAASPETTESIIKSMFDKK